MSATTEKRSPKPKGGKFAAIDLEISRRFGSAVVVASRKQIQPQVAAPENESIYDIRTYDARRPKRTEWGNAYATYG